MCLLYSSGKKSNISSSLIPCQLVPYEEIGRVFSLFGIGGDLAAIFTNLIYNNIYRATVEWFSGFMFEFITGMQMLVFLGMLWVHVQSKRERIGMSSITITRDAIHPKSVNSIHKFKL